MRPARVIAVAVSTVALLSASPGCSRTEFQDRTAEVTLGDTLITFDLEACGLDGTTVFLVGRGAGGSVLQMVMEVEDDGSSGVVDGTGLSVDRGSQFHEAFGPAAWKARGESGPAPGSIAWARLRGSRIQAGGTLEAGVSATSSVPADALPDDTDVPFTVDARCDLQDRNGWPAVQPGSAERQNPRPIGVSRLSLGVRGRLLLLGLGLER